MTDSKGNIPGLIADACEQVAGSWRDILLAEDRQGAACIAPGDRDPFANPRDAIIESTVGKVLAGLAVCCDGDFMVAALEPYMKIQALEAPDPESATEFLRRLVLLVRETFGSGGTPAQLQAAHVLEAGINDWITAAEEIYRKNKNLIDELKIKEKKRMSVRNLKRDAGR